MTRLAMASSCCSPALLLLLLACINLARSEILSIHVQDLSEQVELDVSGIDDLTAQLTARRPEVQKWGIAMEDLRTGIRIPVESDFQLEVVPVLGDNVKLSAHVVTMSALERASSPDKPERVYKRNELSPLRPHISQSTSCACSLVPTSPDTADGSGGRPACPNGAYFRPRPGPYTAYRTVQAIKNNQADELQVPSSLSLSSLLLPPLCLP